MSSYASLGIKHLMFLVYDSSAVIPLQVERNSQAIKIWPIILKFIWCPSIISPSGYTDVIAYSFRLYISTGERPIVDILQDCRYWVIHVITIPALFLSGVVSVASGILFNVAGTSNWLDYFSFVASLSLMNDRFSLGMYLN